MKVHHLNCATMCPHGGRLLSGTGSLRTQAKLICHCLLIETSEGLVLVDSGLGTADVSSPERTVGRHFLLFARPGRDCTVVTYGAMVAPAIAAAEETGIDAEILDLRTLDPLGIDWAAVEASLRRTNRVLIAEQVARGLSHGARIAQEIQERCFDWLDAEILRVTGSEASPVVSRPLNLAALGDAAKVAAALRRLVPVPAA